MAHPQEMSRLMRVFPALKRLGRSLRGKHIPFIPQMEREDCGAACLAMVLGYHGKDVELSEIREATGTTSRDGLTALDIKEAARVYGLRCRAVWLKNVEDLQHVETASVVHVLVESDPDPDKGHFVVFERLTKKEVDILDPASGRRRLPIARFSKLFTGTVLEFEPGEDFEPATGERKGIWPYLRQVIRQSGLLKRILFTSLLIQAFALALPLLTKVLLDRVLPRADEYLLTVLGIGLLAIVLFNLLTSMIRAHLLLHLRTHLDVQLTLSFVEHLMKLPYAFFQKRSTGDLIMRLNSNTTVREVVTSSVLAGFLDGTLVIAYFAILFATSPLMTWIVLAVAALQVGLFALSRRRYRELMTEELSKQAEAQGYEVEMLAGVETLKVAGAEHRASEEWSNRFVDVLNVTLRRGRLSALVESLLGALRMASPMLILWVGAFRVLNGDMSLGTMFAINALAGGLLVPLSSLVGIALQFSTVKSYIERIKDVMEASPEQDESAKSVAPTLQGHLSLDGVSFRYGPPHTPMVVKSVSVDIEPGQHVAIVGRSGSGKSTLARLLVGLYTPTEGRILYDGTDLRGLKYRSVRRQMGFVPQDPYLFGKTIRENIALTNPGLSLDEVKTAARLAHIDGDINAMQSGYGTLLTEGGMSLSGGQRQRVALARALVHKPKILVLDEATSDLDTVNEAAIQKELESLACTVITIAHRLSTIAHADVILVMKDGRLVESGTHGELMALNGEYAKLAAAQMGHDR
ncbi:MAG: peptidase domain-containing ABC transporter [Phycisphaerae bacterium]|nr:peptidase domain-containing ABC transporter [Phycisphaerae bacterium]